MMKVKKMAEEQEIWDEKEEVAKQLRNWFFKDSMSEFMFLEKR